MPKNTTKSDIWIRKCNLDSTKKLYNCDIVEFLPMVFVSLVNDIVFLPNDFVLLQGDTNGL